MPLTPFYSRFRELAFREMRTVTLHGHETIPDGHYGFLEFYCNERGCDCRRVLFHVIRSDSADLVWASVNFGWESPDFYRRWMHGDASDAEEMAGATLDPLNPQTEHAPALLALFQEVCAADPAYVRRLETHYRMFKEEVRKESAKGRPHRRAKAARRR